MKIWRKEVVLFFILITLFLVDVARPDEKTTPKKYPIPNHGVLELNTPVSWKAKTHKAQQNMAPIMIFNPATGTDFQLTMMVSSGKKGEAGFNSAEKVKSLLEQEGQQLLPKITETKLALKEIKGNDHTGFYFTATDKNVDPGEYRYMTRAVIGVGDLLVQATVLHRVKDSGAVKATLSMLREAKQNPK